MRLTKCKIVQLTSLRPTADLFCSLLRDALKVELQRGQMKLVKNFVKTCYSEMLVSEYSNADNEREDGSLITEDKDGNVQEQEVSYHGGLGLKFRFPGDPKKYVFTLQDEYVTPNCIQTS